MEFNLLCIKEPISKPAIHLKELLANRRETKTATIQKIVTITFFELNTKVRSNDTIHNTNKIIYCAKTIYPAINAAAISETIFKNLLFVLKNTLNHNGNVIPIA